MLRTTDLPVEELGLEADAVDHHLVVARPLQRLSRSLAAAEIGAVGEQQNHLAPFHVLELVEARVHGVVETRLVAEVEMLQAADEAVAVAGEPGGELDLVVERTHGRLVVRQQAQQELLGAGIEILQAVGHADARIEHHNGRERAHFVVEDRDFLRLAVVEDLEVFSRQIGDKAVVGVDHRHVRRHDSRARPERGLLGSEQTARVPARATPASPARRE